ncbi:MAG: HPF/RaiA family ribosome-associated protein [Deltaproteobacteria bacterium]|nr:MAG: HPF/RaiA family ribosome-associated protein [Deltaproteobacteria bacterium]
MLPLDVHIEGRNLEILPEWRAKIEEELARLQKHYMDPILHARVTLIGTEHHRLGTFEIHLAASVPGDTITVTRQGEYVLPLIVEALDVLDRRLEEHSHIQQQKVKAHEEFAQHGKILRLFPEKDFGFLEAPDGLEVYFHAHAVKKGKFASLHPGQAVKFAMEEGEKGPQATWVRVE